MSSDIVTIVSTWYGAETAGGAEHAARQLAQALYARGVPVEVWSTTARDLVAPTTAYYPAGTSWDAGIKVVRYAVEALAPDAQFPHYVNQFDTLTRIIRECAPSAQELRTVARLAYSSDLLRAIAQHQAGRRFLFVPYPLPSSVFGSMLAPTRSYLLPCMHDEPYAYHALTRWQMRNARTILANSASERDFIITQYDIPAERVALTRLGIELGVTGDGARFRQHYDIHGTMLFFAGRRDASKNMPLLMLYVQEYMIRRQRMLTLVLSGRDPLTLSRYQQRFIRDIGFVDEQTKADAFAACDVFVHAGTQESFAFVLMEAWLQQRPVLVNAECAVTAAATHESGGGLSFRDFPSFATALDILLATPTLATHMGVAGRAYVLANCQWQDVAARADAAIRGNA